MNIKIVKRRPFVWMVAGLTLLSPPGVWLPGAKVSAAPPGREGLPPGLQKKEKLPPGWQKKVGGEGQAAGAGNAATNAPSTKTPDVPVTKTSDPVRPTPQTPTPTTTTTPTTPTRPTTPTTPATGSSSNGGGSGTGNAAQPPAEEAKGRTASSKPLTREQRENQARFERVIADLETQAARPAGSDRLLHRLSNRQNIALSTLESQLKSHPGLTVPQLYAATLIAREGRLSVEQVLQARKAGQSWPEIAREHKVSVGNLADHLRAAEEVTRDAANTELKRTRN